MDAYKDSPVWLANQRDQTVECTTVSEVMRRFGIADLQRAIETDDLPWELGVFDDREEAVAFSRE